MHMHKIIFIVDIHLSVFQLSDIKRIMNALKYKFFFN